MSEPPAASLWRHRLLVILAALLWSLGGLFIKSPLITEIPFAVRGPVLASYRALAAGCVLFLFVRPKDIRWRPGLVPMVLSFSIMNITFVTSMTMTSAAAAIFLQYTATAWVAIMSWLMLRERIERTTLLSLIGAMCGIAWIVAAERVHSQALGNLIALTSGFTYAFLLVMLRVMKDESSAWLTALNHLASGLLLLPFVLMQDVSLTAAQWAIIIFLGVFQMGLPYVLFARSVKYLSATEAILISLLEPLLNPLLVWLAWGETPDSAILIGGAMILGGLILRYGLEALRRAPVAKPDSIP